MLSNLTKWKKRLLVAAIAAASAFALQTLTYVTYSGYAESSLPRQGIRSLLDYGLLKDRDFVVIDTDTWAVLSESQREVLADEVLRYAPTIYHSRDDVPPAGLATEPTTGDDRRRYEKYKGLNGISPRTLRLLKHEIDAGRRIIGFNRGIELRWYLGGRGLFWVECEAGHWCSMTGGESRSDVYVWMLFWWVRVWNLGHGMS